MGSLKRLPGIDRVDLNSRRLYRTLEQDYGVKLVRAVEWFEPVILRPDEANPLDEEAGGPALLLLRTTYDEGDVPPWRQPALRCYPGIAGYWSSDASTSPPGARVREKLPGRGAHGESHRGRCWMCGIGCRDRCCP